mgnify:CR=1 FL=1
MLDRVALIRLKVNDHLSMLGYQVHLACLKRTAGKGNYQQQVWDRLEHGLANG